MKAQGFDHLTLDCPAASEDARAFWESQGFTGSVSEENEKVVRMTRTI